MRLQHRRTFLGRTALTGGVLTTLPALSYGRAADKPNEKVSLAVMGLRGRGKSLASAFAGFKDVNVVALCDVDTRLFGDVVKLVEKQQRPAPRTVQDVRKLLEERSLDAVVIAAPNHWHALATVWACQAGKDVLVEKPVAHNVVEGRRMIEAARKYDRVVQVGTQRRSSPHWKKAAELVRAGKIGHVATARAWIIRKRKPIGRQPDGPVPEGVDYDLWLGPAPKRPFNANRFHYNWHWFWEYGGGELANNGVHMLDMARLGMGVEAPTSVVSTGGRYVFHDDQETPDTQLVTWEFPNAVLLWEHRQWSGAGLLNEEGNVRIGGGVAFYGDKGTLIVNDAGWRIVVDGKDVESGLGVDESESLLRNFVACIKSRRRPDADIEIGHHSTVLCHLGNIAQRLDRKLRWDAKKELFLRDEAANALLGREYRKPFVVPERV